MDKFVKFGNTEQPLTLIKQVDGIDFYALPVREYEDKANNKFYNIYITYAQNNGKDFFRETYYGKKIFKLNLKYTPDEITSEIYNRIIPDMIQYQIKNFDYNSDSKPVNTMDISHV